MPRSFYCQALSIPSVTASVYGRDHVSVEKGLLVEEERQSDDYDQGHPPESTLIARKAGGKASVLQILAVLLALNWFVSGAVWVWIGGDPLGVRPSVDGFTLFKAGKYTPVSVEFWVFSLVYFYATFVSFPVVCIAAVAAEHWRKLKGNRWGWIIALAVLAWLIVWCSSITKAVLTSVWDWRSVSP